MRGLFMSSIVIARGVSYEFPNGRELFTNLNFSLDARLSALVGSGPLTASETGRQLTSSA